MLARVLRSLREDLSRTNTVRTSALIMEGKNERGMEGAQEGWGCTQRRREIGRGGERERMCLCVCVCVRERERERERKNARERERERKRNRSPESQTIQT